MQWKKTGRRSPGISYEYAKTDIKWKESVSEMEDAAESTSPETPGRISGRSQGTKG